MHLWNPIDCVFMKSYKIILNHRKTKFLQIGRDQGFSKASNLDDKGLSYKESGATKLKIHIENNKFVYGGLLLVVIAGLITLLS